MGVEKRAGGLPPKEERKEMEWLMMAWAAVQLEWNESWMERTSSKNEMEGQGAKRAAKGHQPEWIYEWRRVVGFSSSLLLHWATHQPLSFNQRSWLNEREGWVAFSFQLSGLWLGTSPLTRNHSIPTLCVFISACLFVRTLLKRRRKLFGLMKREVKWMEWEWMKTAGRQTHNLSRRNLKNFVFQWRRQLRELHFTPLHFTPTNQNNFNLSSFFEWNEKNGVKLYYNSKWANQIMKQRHKTERFVDLLNKLMSEGRPQSISSLPSTHSLRMDELIEKRLKLKGMPPRKRAAKSKAMARQQTKWSWWVMSCRSSAANERRSIEFHSIPLRHSCLFFFLWERRRAAGFFCFLLFLFH